MKEKNPCNGCIYYANLGSDTSENRRKFCSYILDTGHKRPCPPGNGCMVRIEGDRRQRIIKTENDVTED